MLLVGVVCCFCLDSSSRWPWSWGRRRSARPTEHRATCVALRGSSWRGLSLCVLQPTMTQHLSLALPEQQPRELLTLQPDTQLAGEGVYTCRSSDGCRPCCFIQWDASNVSISHKVMHPRLTWVLCDCGKLPSSRPGRLSRPGRSMIGELCQRSSSQEPTDHHLVSSF